MMSWMMAGMGLWRHLRNSAADTPVVEGDAARDALRRRYAAGEIDDEEYERRLSGLTWR